MPRAFALEVSETARRRGQQARADSRGARSVSAGRTGRRGGLRLPLASDLAGAFCGPPYLSANPDYMRRLRPVSARVISRSAVPHLRIGRRRSLYSGPPPSLPGRMKRDSRVVERGVLDTLVPPSRRCRCGRRNVEALPRCPHVLGGRVPRPSVRTSYWKRGPHTGRGLQDLPEEGAAGRAEPSERTVYPPTSL